MIKNKIISFKLISRQVFLGAYLPSIVPDVDGSGLLSLRSVVLKKKKKKNRMKQNLLIQNKITQENNMYHMYSHQLIVTKCFCLECKGKSVKTNPDMST